MESKITIKLPVDEDNFFEYCCPYCKRYFRLPTNEYSNDDRISLMCVYCGLSANPGEFLPKNVHDHASAVALSKMKDELIKNFDKFNRNSNLIKLQYDKKEVNLPDKIKLNQLYCKKTKCKKCGNTIKVDDSDEVEHYCPYCGEIY